MVTRAPAAGELARGRLAEPGGPAGHERADAVQVHASGAAYPATLAALRERPARLRRDARDERSRCSATPAITRPRRAAPPRRHLREHDDPDHGGRGGQQRHHQRVGRARQAAHRELVGHVRDHRGRDARRRRPASSATGSVSAGSAAQPASGVTDHSATSIEAASPSMPLIVLEPRRPGGRARCRARTAPRWRRRSATPSASPSSCTPVSR